MTAALSSPRLGRRLRLRRRSRPAPRGRPAAGARGARRRLAGPYGRPKPGRRDRRIARGRRAGPAGQRRRRPVAGESALTRRLGAWSSTDESRCTRGPSGRSHSEPPFIARVARRAARDTASDPHAGGAPVRVRREGQCWASGDPAAPSQRRGVLRADQPHSGKLIDKLTLRVPFDETFAVVDAGLTVISTKLVKRGYDGK